MSVFYGPYNTIINCNVTDGLVLYLDAGQSASYPGSGTVWNDISGNGYVGTLYGPTYDTTGGGNLLFDGSDDYVSVNYTNTSITSVTVQVWVYISSASKRGTFFKMGTGGCDGYSIGVGSTTTEDYGNDIMGLFPCVRWIDTNSTYGTGWKLVTWYLNASSVPYIYVNTTFINSYSGTNPITPSSGLCIGRNLGDEPNGPRAYGGNISQVLVYNKILSSDDITQNFNCSKSRYGL